MRVMHGLSNTKIYDVWRSIIKRTTKEYDRNYSYYGGNGISVCSDWLDFKTFHSWAIDNGYSEGLQIDRIDSCGNYEPNNCRWTTKFTQARNTRRIMSTNKSGYRGVSFKKDKRKWVAQINVNKKKKHLGYFTNPLDAAKAYDKYVTTNKLEHTLNGVI